MDIDDEGAMVNIWNFEEHGKYLKFHMELCIGCDLCRLLCPTSCIELGPVPEIASGSLEGVPPILINHEKCAYCGLCYAICPTNAFEFYTEPGDFLINDDLPHFHYKTFVRVIQKDLTRKFEEPASSWISVSEEMVKPSDGEVILREDLLDRCDPMGCKGCLNICPTDCFWVPKRAIDIQERGKITMNDDLCIHCGACKNACPEKIIEVTRTSINYDIKQDGKHKFWKQAWENNIKKLLDPEILERQEIPFPEIKVEEMVEPEITDDDKSVVKEIPPEIKKRLKENYDKVKESLSKVNIRYWIEFEKIEKLKKKIADKLNN